ncbi:DUF898 family protein [Nocardioides sp. dk4132]|nr:DUF898 family protein [Nocardioides sp. dk4132]QGA09700.1 DUF898 family protein [Nocardioides sp. dk884]
MERWRAKHSYVDGQRLAFTGSATGLFGRWILWFLLIVIPLDIYLPWVGPRIAQWKWEHTDGQGGSSAAPGLVGGLRGGCPQAL